MAGLQDWGSLLLILEMKLLCLSSLFFFLFCFTSAIHTEVPARDLSSEPILILIQVYFWTSQLLLQSAQMNLCEPVKETKKQGEDECCTQPAAGQGSPRGNFISSLWVSKRAS